MDFFEALNARYSHKEEFLPDAVPLEVLEKICQAGINAPNGVNRQVVRFIILPNRASIDPLAAVSSTAGLATAPAAIAVLTDTTITPVQPGVFNFEKEDYSAAVTQMLLAATAQGYSSLWLDSPYFDAANRAKATQVLGAPDTMYLWAVLPVGKPKGEGSRRGRMAFEDRVSYGKFGHGK
ncbi:MAG: nitroreductase family protein [Defluviitaleaceae bacterium]|nr:nitroreductase family protein [Defluviitaleaceae bacterium]